jgi:adenine/guanine phosphoribosyltransferase-like PRPP-binding protein
VSIVTSVPAIAFEVVSKKLRDTELPAADLVVGIGSGGIVPAAMTAHELQVPMVPLWLNYRDQNNKPRHSLPQLYQPFKIPFDVNHILLIDDVVVSGKTLDAAMKLLPLNIRVTTLTLKGCADIVLFPEIESCVQWPWNPPRHNI